MRRTLDWRGSAKQIIRETLAAGSYAKAHQEAAYKWVARLSELLLLTAIYQTAAAKAHGTIVGALAALLVIATTLFMVMPLGTFVAYLNRRAEKAAAWVIAAVATVSIIVFVIVVEAATKELGTALHQLVTVHP